METTMNSTRFVFLLSVCCFFVENLLASEFLSLNGQWTATSANGSIQVEGQVPGGIYTDLLKNNKIDDPYYRFNDINYRWVGKTSWNYSRSFTISSFLNNTKINLACEGLDTVAKIYINDVLIGSSDNMFVRYVYDIKSSLHIGSNMINIVFESPVAYALKQYNNFLAEKYSVPPACPVPIQNGECHANFIRKIQSQFSWDWGPAFPSVGIWKDIRLEAFDSAILRDIIVSAYKYKENIWRLEFMIFWDVASLNSMDGELKILLDANVLYNEKITIKGDSSFVAQTNLNITVPETFDIKLWWPNGLGEQTLYNVTVVFASKEFNEITSKTIRIGFRTVELVQEPIPNVTGLTFYFRINGVKTFMKGSNWIPADSFPERITPEYTRRLLLSAKEAHMNVLRVWGGGMYETNLFYDYADELGIMIWQDLMFACAMYPASDSFLDNIQTEVTQQIKRLQHHPSILLWSGNNENEAALMENWYGTKSKFDLYKADYLKLYVATIQPLAAKLDSNRPFLLSSPSNGLDTEKEGGLAKDPQSPLYGDVHFYDYVQDSWNWTIYPIPRFISEYGIQSWTSFETLSRVSIAEDWNLNSEFADHRQHHLFGNLQISNSIKKHFGISGYCTKPEYCYKPEEQFNNFIYLSQISQAMGIKTASEHYLRKQSTINNNQGLTMGALYWQLNDIWQCPSWSSTEYGGKWKMLHYYAKNFFAPIIVSPFEEEDKFYVSVVSDASIEDAYLRLDLYVYQWKSFIPYYGLNVTFYQKPQTAKIIFDMKLNSLLDNSGCPGRPYCFMYLTLTDMNSHQIVSSNFYFLTPFHQVQGLYNAHINITVQNGSCSSFSSECTFSLLLKSDEIAPFVWLEAKGITGRFSDNGFLLISPRTELQFYSWEIVSADQLMNQISVRTLMSVYNKQTNYFK